MVTMAQRIEELRTERGLSRPALSAALGFAQAKARGAEGESRTAFRSP